MQPARLAGGQVLAGVGPRRLQQPVAARLVRAFFLGDQGLADQGGQAGFRCERDAWP
jgi:hypothetical protein